MHPFAGPTKEKQRKEKKRKQIRSDQITVDDTIAIRIVSDS